jgi:NADH-quinone oxidoreductase subunit A
MDDKLSILAPPIAFFIMLAAVGLLSFGLSRLSADRTGKRKTGPYACGELIPTHMVQPDYGQFLPFAFFFTILHVMALMAGTVFFVSGAAWVTGAVVIGVMYLVAAVLGLYVLYAR